MAVRQENLIILSGDVHLGFLSFPRPFAFAKAGKAGKHERLANESILRHASETPDLCF
jgi:hypothetical protein